MIQLSPTAEQIDRIVAEMRMPDQVELQRMGFPDARAGLEFSLRNSDWNALCLVDGEPLGAFGYTLGTTLGGGGSPWVLTTRAVERHKRAFLIVSRLMRDAMLAACGWHLDVLIDAGYAGALRWAKWLGFRLSDPVPWGPHGSPVIRARLDGGAT